MPPFLRLLPILLPALASAAPLTIDLTTPVPAPAAVPYGPGTTTNPQGHSITADSWSFLLDGKPWVPIVGEFHYSRYPRDEWRDELLKMKAGGISVVSTYVFWIHQEEIAGKFDWTGQRSLRDFLLLCQDLGLKVVVRLGPWCHGEVRNGGFPDWVQNSGTRLRSPDPAFLSLVDPLYKEEAKQMQGLLWKEGGPVIGVQLDNECNNAPYLRALKQMARADGIDVPYYTITGWQITVPAKDFMPLFGGYADGFWGGKPDGYRREFMFTPTRATNNLGAQLNDQYPSNSKVIAQFPYACAEIGPGMMSSYAKRILVDPNVVSAMALTKLGCGNNMPGYYMYQGGINPDAEEPSLTLQETHPNFMPLKDYDFQTALGACGEVREQFHLLLEQHLFLEDFGASLARMPAFFPDQKPASLRDFDTLRWDVRSDGTGGFLFFSNEQPSDPLPEHTGVQFQVKTAAGALLIPSQPVTIPSGSYGIWPVNMDCDGVKVVYATAQPLCRIDAGNGSMVYFFSQLDGIAPEFVISGAGGGGRHYVLNPDTRLSFKKPAGGSVSFVVLSPEESRRVWRAPFAGRERLILSKATVLADGGALRLLSDNAKDLAVSVFPALTSGTTLLKGAKDGVFSRIATREPPQPAPVEIGFTLEQPAGPGVTGLSGTNESTWEQAAVYKLAIPSLPPSRRVILHIHYRGDAVRLYVGDKLYDDNYFNGGEFDIALWRIPQDQWAGIRLKILPWSDALERKLPAPVSAAVHASNSGPNAPPYAAATELFETRLLPN